MTGNLIANIRQGIAKRVFSVLAREKTDNEQSLSTFDKEGHESKGLLNILKTQLNRQKSINEGTGDIK